MALVDLLEAGLRLSDDAIGCSSLPGYAVGDDARVAIASAGVVIAWVDDAASHDPRMAFELGLALGLEKWIVVVAETPEAVRALPWSLGSPTIVSRADESALRSLVEDVGFELQLPPRLGAEAEEAIARVSVPPPAAAIVSSAPPRAPAPARSSVPPKVPLAARVSSSPPARSGVRSPVPPARTSMTPPLGLSTMPPVSSSPPAPPRPTERAHPHAAVSHPVEDYESLDSVPPDPSSSGMHTPVVPPHDRVPDLGLGGGREDTQELELGDVDVASPSAALEAGRAMSDCVFNRDEGGDLAAELGGTFGKFIDSVGGEWHALSRIEDPDVWVEAAENLLAALPAPQRGLADWYALGFEFALLLNLSALGVPQDAEDRAEFIHTWQDTAGRFRALATSCLGDEAATRVHYRLDSLIGPEEDRDYSTVATTLGELREYAARMEALA